MRFTKEERDQLEDINRDIIELLGADDMWLPRSSQEALKGTSTLIERIILRNRASQLDVMDIAPLANINFMAQMLCINGLNSHGTAMPSRDSEGKLGAFMEKIQRTGIEDMVRSKCEEAGRGQERGR